MNYVVVDLEWNQAMSSKSSVFNRLPIHLRGEIIHIPVLFSTLRSPDEIDAHLALESLVERNEGLGGRNALDTQNSVENGFHSIEPLQDSGRNGVGDSFA